MIQRCYNENCKKYRNYGGRGIRVCNDWRENFISFYNWSVNNSYSETLTIDRIDNDLNYSPENCRWSDYSNQNQNKRTVNKRSDHLYTGVYKSRNGFQSKITKYRTVYCLGTYSTQEDAARAYNKKAIELYGDNANLNDVPNEYKEQDRSLAGIEFE